MNEFARHSIAMINRQILIAAENPNTTDNYVELNRHFYTCLLFLSEVIDVYKSSVDKFYAACKLVEIHLESPVFVDPFASAEYKECLHRLYHDLPEDKKKKNLNRFNKIIKHLMDY